METLLLFIALCGLVVQIHRDDDMILNFKEVSIPTQLLIMGVFGWLVFIVFSHQFFVNQITLSSFNQFIKDIWILFISIVGLGWILLENVFHKSLRFISCQDKQKYHIISLRIIGFITMLLYLYVRFY